MFPAQGRRIGWTGWRVILTDSEGEKRTVVVSASTKRAAIVKARGLWKESAYACDASVVSGFDPTWFDVAWASPDDDDVIDAEFEVGGE